jgi:hypothetical protein
LPFFCTNRDSYPAAIKFLRLAPMKLAKIASGHFYPKFGTRVLLSPESQTNPRQHRHQVLFASNI